MSSYQLSQYFLLTLTALQSVSCLHAACMCVCMRIAFSPHTLHYYLHDDILQMHPIATTDTYFPAPTAARTSHTYLCPFPILTIPPHVSMQHDVSWGTREGSVSALTAEAHAVKAARAGRRASLLAERAEKLEHISLTNERVLNDIFRTGAAAEPHVPANLLPQ